MMHKFTFLNIKDKIIFPIMHTMNEEIKNFNFDLSKNWRSYNRPLFGEHCTRLIQSKKMVFL